MESSLKLMRTVHIAMLVALLLYIFVGERIPHHSRPISPVFYYVITSVAISLILLIVFFRRVTIMRSEGLLAQGETGSRPLYLWRLGQIATSAISETVAMFGFTLRILGFSFPLVAPFYLAGIVLLLFFSPRPPSNIRV